MTPEHPGRKLFVNLAVEDLDRSVEFFSKLGFSFDPQFTDETGTCMLVGADAYAMLLTKQRFADFTTREAADSTRTTEAILAFSVEGRQEVDRLADLALDSGGSPVSEAHDHGFMYLRSFNDPDGHHWEVFWMDPKAAEEGPAAMDEAASTA